VLIPVGEPCLDVDRLAGYVAEIPQALLERLAHERRPRLAEPEVADAWDALRPHGAAARTIASTSVSATR
jgi:hypothetical protein